MTLEKPKIKKAKKKVSGFVAQPINPINVPLSY